jgi:hypothetical protein
MKILEINLEELEYAKLEEITGVSESGIFFSLGAAAHEAWSAIEEMASSIRATHSQYGYIK